MQPQKKSHKAIILAICAVMIAILGVIVTTIFMQNSLLENKSDNLRPDLLEAQAYENQEHGVRIYYPKGWEVAELGNNIFATIKNPEKDTANENEYQASISLETRPTNDRPLDDFVENMLDTIPVDYELTGNNETSISGIPARMLEYTITDINDTSATFMQAVLIKDDTAYIITGTSITEKWESYEDAIDASIYTTRILKNS